MNTHDTWATPAPRPDENEGDNRPYEEPNHTDNNYDRTGQDRSRQPTQQGGSFDGTVYESSGDDYSPITETSPVYTNQPAGCRGDSTFTCHFTNTVICDEQLCDGVEQCPDGEDESNCPTEEDNGYPYEKGIKNFCVLFSVFRSVFV